MKNGVENSSALAQSIDAFSMSITKWFLTLYLIKYKCLTRTHICSSKYPLRLSEGIGMGFYDITDMLGIASTHAYGHWQLALGTCLKDRGISFSASFQSHGQPTEFIGLEHVYPLK